MKRLLAAALLVAISPTLPCRAQAPTAAGPTVQAVEASLAEGNPRATLEKYFSCEKVAGSAYPGIESGSPRWIALAEKMLQHSDACYTEGIQGSLGKAMQRSPRNVLPLVDKTPVLAAASICLPFISSEIPIKTQQIEVARSRKAIAKVHDGKLKVQKDACLQFIKSVEASLSSASQPSAPEKPR